MDRMTAADVPTWLLSGEPVVQLQGRDFSQSSGQYAAWLNSLARELKFGVAVLEIADPPGVVAQAFTGERVPELHDPLLKVTKAKMGWLFCIELKCRNRVDTPGSVCSAVHK